MLRQGAGDSLLAERLPVNPVAARALAVLLGNKGDGARYHYGQGARAQRRPPAVAPGGGH